MIFVPGESSNVVGVTPVCRPEPWYGAARVGERLETQRAEDWQPRGVEPRGSVARQVKVSADPDWHPAASTVACLACDPTVAPRVVDRGGVRLHLMLMPAVCGEVNGCPSRVDGRDADGKASPPFRIRARRSRPEDGSLLGVRGWT